MIKIKCFARVCKFNKNGECTKFKDRVEMINKGCAYTWFVTGQYPEDTSHLK
jgi:hypothetical protein